MGYAWYICLTPDCKFASNSAHQAALHAEAYGHYLVTQDDTEDCDEDE